MGIDRERIIQKAAFIKEQTAALRSLAAQRSKAAILGDRWVIKGIKYSLQTAIEACIDLAYHICAKRLSQAPVESRDAFKRLAAAGIISEAELLQYSAMVGFRNRVVHGYQEVADELVYGMLGDDLNDLDAFADRALSLLENG
jgi:uncharacterized protein YutE (UPF0331/DUF86 family)